MPTKISKDKIKSVTTEWEVRPIDENGDCIDPQFCDDLAEAKAMADDLESRSDYYGTPIKAVVIEKHVSRFPAHMHSEPDTYTTIETRGDRAALEVGGWLD